MSESVDQDSFTARPDFQKSGHEHREIKFVEQGTIFAHAGINSIPICVLANALPCPKTLSHECKKVINRAVGKTWLNDQGIVQQP
jgi:hypothetical protein